MRIPHGLRAALAGQGGAAPATDSDFENVSLLLHGDGTNGAQNNTFTDGSTNNFTITRNGNTTQGTFSPFSPTGWSGYFDGSGDYLSAPSNAAFNFGTGAFTIEAWVYLSTVANNASVILNSSYGGNDGDWIVRVGAGALAGKWEFTTWWGGTNYSASSNSAAVGGTWTHLAAVRSGNTFTLYVNGVAQTTTATNTNSVGSSSLSTLICGDNSSGVLLTGYISNLRIVKGTAVYTSNFTPPTSPLTAITNTSLLTLQDNRFKDNSTNNFTITRNGNTKIEAFSPFNPTAAYSASTHGGSGYFQDAVADYLTTTSSSQFNMGTGDWTVEGWFYTNKANGEMNVAWHIGAINASDGMSGGVARDAVVFRSNGTVTITGAVSIASQWAHVAWVKVGSSNTVTVYVNGVSAVSGTYSNSIATNAFTCGFNNTSFRYGGYISGLRVLKGTALYTSAFTPPTAPLTAITNTSLLLNFTNGGIIDNASKNVLETVGNAQISTSVKKFGTGSMYFDGTGDWAIIPYGQNFNFGTGDFTVECWANISYVQYSAIITSTNTSIASSNWLLGYSNTTNQMAFGIDAGGSAIVGADYSSYHNAWTHIAASRSGSTLRLFFNGSQVASATSTASFTGDSANPIIIGRRYTNNSQYPLNGYIDDLRITKGVARYTANFTPPTAALPDL